MMKQRYILFALILMILIQPSCQVVYFVLPQKYEDRLKTKKKERYADKALENQEEERQKQQEKLREQWLEMQTDETREQIKKLEKESRKRNRKRKHTFFLWRWLGL